MLVVVHAEAVHDDDWDTPRRKGNDHSKNNM